MPEAATTTEPDDGTDGPRATADDATSDSDAATVDADADPGADPDADADEEARGTAGRRAWWRSRRLLVATGVVVALVVGFLVVTAFTGLPAPGSFERYPVSDLSDLASRVNDDAGNFRTPDDCWRIVHDANGPLRPIAGVDYLRSRVVVRAYSAPSQAGYVDAITFNTIADHVDRIIASDPRFSWGMVELEPSPDGWSPLVSCSLVTRGY